MGLSIAEPPHHYGFEVQNASTDTPIPESSTTALQMARPRSNLMNTPSTRDRTVERKQRRPSSFGHGSVAGGAEYDDLRQCRVRIPLAPSTLTGRSSTTPTPTKRAFSDEDDDVPSTDYGTRKDRTRALSLSAIIESLENLTGQTGLYDHIKRISVKSHISPRFRSFRFSRGSIGASEGSTAPGTSMHEPNSPKGNEAFPIPYEPDPDYANFYHHPTSARMAQVQSMGAGVVASLMSAKACSMSDEDAESHLLKASLDETGAVASFVNAVDDKGITALHLAVAYGYPRVCRYLMQNLANPFAVTNRGSSVCRFARPAQDFAKELSLYHRILYCRQWICAGLAPPTTDDTDVQSSPDMEEGGKPRPTLKRIKTNDTGSTLFTVEETPTEETAMSAAYQLAPRNSAMLPKYTALTPLITDCEFGMGHSTIGQPLGPPVSDYDSSPMSMRHCLRDHDRIGDLLTPDSFSPNVTFWPVGAAPIATQIGPVSTALQPSSQPAEATAQQWDSFGGLNIMTNFSPNGQLTPSASFPSQYNGASHVASTSNFVPGTAMPFDWPTADLQHTGQILADASYLSNGCTLSANFERSQDQSFGYQERYEHQAPSQLHYPTPPSESRPMRQQSWQPDGDVSHATALALSDQTSFPSAFWYSDDHVAPTSNQYVLMPLGAIPVSIAD